MSLVDIPVPVFVLAAMTIPVAVAQAILRRTGRGDIDTLRLEAAGIAGNVALFGGAAVVDAWGLIVGRPLFRHLLDPPLDPVRLVI